MSVVYFIANRRDRTRLIFGYGLITLSWWRVLLFLCRSRLLGDPLHVVIDPSDGSCRHNYDISDRISWPESQGYEPRHARSQFRSMSIYSSFRWFTPLANPALHAVNLDMSCLLVYAVVPLRIIANKGASLLVY